MKDWDEFLIEYLIEEENVFFIDVVDLIIVFLVGGVFLEILKRENNVLISDNEELKV